MLLHLDGDTNRDVRLAVLDEERIVDLGQVLRLELDVEHRADHLDDASDVLVVFAGRPFFSVAIAVAM